MCNTGKNSNSSQFFITFDSCTRLTGKHVVFGEITEGLEVLERLEAIGKKTTFKPYRAGEGSSQKALSIRVFLFKIAFCKTYSLSALFVQLIYLERKKCLKNVVSVRLL